MDDLKKLEEKLAKLHERKYCKLLGNGTTAIYLALKVQNIEKQNIALPNNVCMNVVLPIYFLNNKPIFIDSEKETLGLNVELLKDQEIDTLIAVHAYGNVYDVDAVEKYCKQKNIFHIEDVAIAQGMTYANKKLGSFGDCSILSFGAGKMLDIGHGGAILTDDETFFKAIVKESALLKEFDLKDADEVSLIGREHTRLYNLDYGRSFRQHTKRFKKECLEKKEHYLYKFDTKYLNILDNALNGLDALLALRQENSGYLKKKFMDADVSVVTLLEPKYDSGYWRFNLFVEMYRDELFSYLLRKKYKVSSWQHSIDTLFEEDTIDTPVSSWIGEKIINIWVNEEIDKDYLDAISEDIIDFLKGKENDRR